MTRLQSTGNCPGCGQPVIVVALRTTTIRVDTDTDQDGTVAIMHKPLRGWFGTFAGVSSEVWPGWARVRRHTCPPPRQE